MFVAIYTLGCKVNQYESAAIEGALRAGGHVTVPFDGPADAYIINSCTVTAVSDHKSRQAIRRAKRANPNGVVAVCGCYAQMSPEAVAALGVDLVGGAADRMQFVADLEALAAKKKDRPSTAAPCITVSPSASHSRFEPLTADGPGGRTRALLKVEDGCQNYCAYCIIPYARGPVRSLPPAEAVGEAKRLAGEGYRELVLTGIEISSWSWAGPEGDGAPPLALIDLLEAVCAAAPDVQIRLGSLEPRTITEDFCRRAARLPNLCPHFHLSLQSGCDATLARMNRKYDSARYRESVALLRQHFENPGLTTDLIVGFPGETEEEFAQTLAFAAECRFSAMHIFPYSRRSGTPAARMEGQCSNGEKEARANRARAAAAAMERAYLQGFVGKTITALFETEKDGLWRGHSPNYAEVRAEGTGLHNQKAAVMVTAAEGTYLAGTVVP